MIQRTRNALFALLMVVAIGVPSAAPAQTPPPTEPTPQEYVIGPDDVLQISVWLHPELERTVTVNTRGTVVFPPVGEIKATGSTAKEFGNRISDRLSTYLRQTTTVTVTITQFMSHSITVSGAVARPGRYGFETVPSIVDVLSQAGGALPTAELGRVQVLRRDGTNLSTLTADLTLAIQTGSVEGLPVLRPGDVVVVPGVSSGNASMTADAVGVVGEVNRPGVYTVGQGLDLWYVIAQAGGPTGRGNLEQIRVLSREKDGRPVTVNLLETLDHGNRSPYVVKPGDIVYLEARNRGLGESFLVFLGVTRDVLTVIALVDALNHSTLFH
jgi:polysaccharide export outer membrane protein